MSQRHNIVRLKWLFLGKEGSKIYADTLKTSTQQKFNTAETDEGTRQSYKSHILLHLVGWYYIWRNEVRKTNPTTMRVSQDLNLQMYSDPKCYQTFKIHVKLKTFVENKFTKLLDFNIIESKVIIRIWRLTPSIVRVTLNTHEVAKGGFAPLNT